LFGPAAATANTPKIVFSSVECEKSMNFFGVVYAFLI